MIGANGRCGVCGKPAKAAAVAVEPAGVAAAATTAEPTDDAPATATAVDPEGVARPCGDAACSGVIGTDDQCTVCGKVVS